MHINTIGDFVFPEIVPGCNERLGEIKHSIVGCNSGFGAVFTGNWAIEKNTQTFSNTLNCITIIDDAVAAIDDDDDDFIIFCVDCHFLSHGFCFSFW